MTLHKLDGCVAAKVNMVLEQTKLFSCVQGADEDIASYVAALRGLSLTCQFENLSDSLIRDQIMRCTETKRVKEKLLIKDPTLEEAIEIAKGLEHTQLWMKEMDKNSGSQLLKEQSAKVSEVYMPIDEVKKVKPSEKTQALDKSNDKAQF
ncbi:hypothetical protein NDU88_002126 [Pleurodeles waltl]|uniref:Uncharacterized protein n=1 Tax=Pleurodeles waltl TaxID=8319 RepID=A0AAV7LDB1_PLEWA|nr:hypothetical protein NDU88_002126 [Pleurodeles waltl]